MPNISTRAATAAYAYGMFSYSPPPRTTGTFGVFRYAQAQTSKYVFATSATSVSNNSWAPVGYSPMAFGTGVAGYFAAWTAGNALMKYTFASDVASPSTANSVGMSSGYAAGNADLAILNAANPNAVRFTYASEAFSTGATFAFSVVTGAAAGNAELGIFGHGTSTTECNKYVYASDFVLGLPALALPLFKSGAVGTATFGLFFCGDSPATLRYVFSDDSSVAATSMLGATNWSAIAGNEDMAVVALSRDSNETNIYTYASNTVAVGVSVAAGSGQLGSGVSNGTSGVNI